jgi:hypothetical protein
MNDESSKKSATDQQPRNQGVGTGEPPGIMLVERPVKPDRVEIKVPLGVAVMVASREWGTKIVLLGFPCAEKGHADGGDAGEST